MKANTFGALFVLEVKHLTAILFTQCLQHDFVRPLERFEPLPNLLHVGYAESLRLMGEVPEQGPVARIMEWAYDQPDLAVIHLRDWHDDDDPEQKQHLQRFGMHCLKDSAGAEFCFVHQQREKVDIVNSLSLNDFQATGLESLLKPYLEQSLRVGFM